MGSLFRKRPAVVLFDRDGTLVHDDPTLRDAKSIRVIDGAASALARLRANGMRIGVVTNQPRIAMRQLALAELDAIHDEIERQLGAIDAWAICPHAPDLGCYCRKPQPGLILAAARRLHHAPHACVMVGDIASDTIAAARAGASSILVPTPVTLPTEVAAAHHVAATLGAAVDRILASDR